MKEPSKSEAIQVFEFGSSRVRTAGTHKHPLFCAADVCAALDMAGGSRNAIAGLDQGETELVLIESTSGRKRAVFVNESGLYGLIFGSRKPEAKAFKRWVTSEVLPSIREHGRYEYDQHQTQRLLAECFPRLPSRAKPIFTELIAALLKLRGEKSQATPPWARQLASWVYGWAIRVEGQQQTRRALNNADSRRAGRKDHSMLGDAADEAVRRVIQSGIDISCGCFSVRDWKLKMDMAFGHKALQLPLMGPLLDAGRNPPPQVNR